MPPSIRSNIRDEDAVRSAVAAILNVHSQIDGLVNNAGGCLRSTQRHCAHASLVIEQGTAPAQRNRESPAQHGTASHGADPSSLASAGQRNDGAA